MAKDPKAFQISQIFNDRNGKTSSKRVITFIAFALMCIAFIVNLVFKIPMESFIYEGMMYIVAGGLGFSALEHFSPGSLSKNDAPAEGKVENPELLEG